MSAGCPRVAAEFRRAVNMTPRQIRAWKANPESKRASFASTRARLPRLADLRATAPTKWTAADCRFAQRVVNFTRRFDGMIRKHGCTDKMTVAQRNWGRQPPGCPRP